MKHDNLKALRNQLGISIAKAAMQTHITYRSWARYESGERPIPEGVVHLFCVQNNIEYPPAIMCEFDLCTRILQVINEGIAFHLSGGNKAVTQKIMLPNSGLIESDQATPEQWEEANVYLLGDTIKKTSELINEQIRLAVSMQYHLGKTV